VGDACVGKSGRIWTVESVGGGRVAWVTDHDPQTLTTKPREWWSSRCGTIVASGGSYERAVAAPVESQP